MTTVAEIAGAVKRLPKKDLVKFRKWFVDYDAAAWDRQLQSDQSGGRLDAMVREARRDHRAGRTKAL
ncbi:MAG: hypothetical protein AB1806_02555 [Acidobacteriota bacterium]